ncbi:MAG: hypothetical protein ACSHX6_09590 [Akkermansiaceae bacterium]
MKIISSCLKPIVTICSLALLSSTAISSAQKKVSDANSHVRLMKNADGSTTQFKRDLNNTTLEKSTFVEKQNGEKIIRTRTTYTRDKQGRLRSGVIEDGQRIKLYKLRYGYDPRTGRLIAENMYDARTVRRNDPANPTKETPVRALRYSYTAQGERSKPIVYVGVSGRTAEELQKWLKENKFEKGTFPDVDPFAPKTANPNATRLRN